MMHNPVDIRKLDGAVVRGDLEEVKAIMRSESLEVEELTLALPSAVLGDHVEIVNFLLEKGADLHYFYSTTPLIISSVLRGKMTMFYTLLPYCRDLNFEYKKGSLAHAAVKVKNLTVLQELHKFPKPFLLFDKPDETNHRTPLHEAVAVISLEKHDPHSARNELSEGPLQGQISDMTISEEHTIQVADEESAHGQRETTQSRFTRNSSRGIEAIPYPLESQIVRFLLGRNCNPNVRDKYQRTPLHDAAAGGNLDIVLMLINAGAFLYIEDATGSLPWTEAVTNGYEFLGKYLLKEEDLYRTFESGRKNLNHAHYAISKSVLCVQYLIKRGMDMSHVNLLDLEGLSPLIKAIKMGKHECASLLVRFSGPIMNWQTTTKYVAIDYALNAWTAKSQVWWKKILDDMIKHGANLNQFVGVHKIHILMQREHLISPWKLDWILQHNLELNVQSKEGWSLFHLAVHHIASHRPNHVAIKVMFNLLNHGMRVPTLFSTVRAQTQENTVSKSSPLVAALRTHQFVLSYLLHLIGCHSRELEIEQWYHSERAFHIRNEERVRELVEYLIECEKSPPSLQEITRTYVIKLLPSGKVMKYAEKLPLPITLIKRFDWVHEIDCKHKALPEYYRVIKEMLLWPEEEKDSPEWKEFCFEPELTFDF